MNRDRCNLPCLWTICHKKKLDSDCFTSNSVHISLSTKTFCEIILIYKILVIIVMTIARLWYPLFIVFQIEAYIRCLLIIYRFVRIILILLWRRKGFDLVILRWRCLKKKKKKKWGFWELILYHYKSFMKSNLMTDQLKNWTNSMMLRIKKPITVCQYCTRCEIGKRFYFIQYLCISLFHYKIKEYRTNSVNSSMNWRCIYIFRGKKRFLDLAHTMFDHVERSDDVARSKL